MDDTDDAATVPDVPDAMHMIRIFVVEDDPTFADALVAAIDAASDMECVGVAQDAASAPAGVTSAKPAVAVIDIHLPDGDGLTLCQRLKADSPDLRTVVLTADDDPATVVKAMHHGADGFALKLPELDSVLTTIRFVHAGSRIYDADHL